MTKTPSISRVEEITKSPWTLEANFHVPIGEREVAFGFPAFGPNNYNAVVKQTLLNGQRLPTGEQTAFMLDEAYNSANPEVKNSPRTEFVRKDIMSGGWLWVPSVNIWTPM